MGVMIVALGGGVRLCEIGKRRGGGFWGGVHFGIWGGFYGFWEEVSWWVYDLVEGVVYQRPFSFLRSPL
jgi:hypothetical protein